LESYKTQSTGSRMRLTIFRTLSLNIDRQKTNCRIFKEPHELPRVAGVHMS
jgi:hypothetical protein